jgi:uncharacterized protein (DUF427 family)
MGRPQRIEPGPGQESVWDYPRPPRVDPSDALVRVVHGGHVVAETRRAVRVLETSQPPGFYLPIDDIDAAVLAPSTNHSWCEWKGAASYVDLVVPGTPRVSDAGWRYLDPTPSFAAIAGHVAFYPQRVDACFVDEEQVQANEGDFYGGWITSKVVGPFKGGAGTWGW